MDEATTNTMLAAARKPESLARNPPAHDRNRPALGFFVDPFPSFPAFRDDAAEACPSAGATRRLDGNTLGRLGSSVVDDLFRPIMPTPYSSLVGPILGFQTTPQFANALVDIPRSLRNHDVAPKNQFL
jgi:hypothetical protein